MKTKVDRLPGAGEQQLRLFRHNFKFGQHLAFQIGLQNLRFSHSQASRRTQHSYDCSSVDWKHCEKKALEQTNWEATRFLQTAMCQRRGSAPALGGGFPKQGVVGALLPACLPQAGKCETPHDLWHSSRTRRTGRSSLRQPCGWVRRGSPRGSPWEQVGETWEPGALTPSPIDPSGRLICSHQHPGRRPQATLSCFPPETSVSALISCFVPLARLKEKI